jgi:tetratricopeptide (TPR) repeat protein
MWMGQLDQALDHLQQAVAMHDPAHPPGALTQFGVDPRAGGQARLAWTLCLLGRVERSKQMLIPARSNEHSLPQDAARNRLHLALRGMCARDVIETRTDARALAELSVRHKLDAYSRYAECLLAWADLESGDNTTDAMARLERGVAYLSRGARLYGVLFQAHLAVAHAAHGQQEQALEMIERATDDSDGVSPGWCDAELWRLRGSMFTHGTLLDLHEAERCLARALVIARDQGAGLWELRSAVSLAQLHFARGDAPKATGLLLAVSKHFNGGCAADLTEASALMTQLGLCWPSSHPDDLAATSEQ